MARALRDILGNLEPSIDIYPTNSAPWSAMHRTVNVSLPICGGGCRRRWNA